MTNEFHETKTYLRCRCCEYEVDFCDECNKELVDDDTIYCSKDSHVCEDCVKLKEE